MKKTSVLQLHVLHGMAFFSLGSPEILLFSREGVGVGWGWGGGRGRMCHALFSYLQNAGFARLVLGAHYRPSNQLNHSDRRGASSLGEGNLDGLQIAQLHLLCILFPSVQPTGKDFSSLHPMEETKSVP